MNISFSLRDGSDVYDILILNDKIVKITKYCGESRFAREILYLDLPESVKTSLAKRLAKFYG